VVVCETDCKFIYLSKKDFLLWLKKSPETLYQVTVAIIKKNTSQVSHDRAFLFSTGEDRLAYHLDGDFFNALISTKNDILIRFNYHDNTGDYTKDYKLKYKFVKEIQDLYTNYGK